MAIKVTLKNSVVQDSVPTTSHLAAVGELALNANINSLGIYMRASDNSIVKMAGPGSVTTPAASTTVAGIAELATSGETTTGTDTARVTTPAGVKAVTDAERTTSNNTYLAKAGGTLTGVLAATAGSNSAASIHFGDTDSGLFGGTNTVSLTAGGTTRLTADTGVSVIGTLAVTGAITSTSDLTIADKVIHSGDTDTAIRFPAVNTVSVETGGSERARVDSSGRLLVGLSSSLSNGCLFQVARTNDNTAELYTYSANTNGPVVTFTKSRNGTLGSNTIVQSGDTLGQISFRGADGTGYIRGASIQAKVDGTPGTDDMPGRLEFSTTADGASTQSTRLTIDNAGLVNVPDNGKFTAGASDDLAIYHDGSNSRIHNSTGELIFRTGTNYTFYNSDASEKHAQFLQNGAVELYYDNDRKFKTTSNGVEVETSSGDVKLLVHAEHDDSGSDAFIQAYTENNQAKCYLMFGDSDDTFVGGLKYDNSADQLAIYTNNAAQWYITSDGHLRNNSDSNKIQLGESEDLQIYHDGSNSYLQNSTGYLFTQTDNYSLGAKSVGENMIIANVNDGVDLYYDNVKKLETTSVGVKVTGNYQAVDGYHIYLGTGNDLDIYHNGTNSFIESNTGELYFKNASSTLVKLGSGGEVELHYNGSKKLQTTSSGFQMYGHLFADDDNKIQLGTSQDLQIFHDGSESHIHDAGTGSLRLRSNAFKVMNAANNEAMIYANEDGAVELYHDNIKTFLTDSNGITVQGPEGGNGVINLYADEGDDNVDKWRLQAHTNSYFYLANYGDAAWETNILAKPGAEVQLYHDNGKRFETTAYGIKVIGPDNNAATIDLSSDLETHAADMFRLHVDDGGPFYIKNYKDGAWENNLAAIGSGSLYLYYDNVKKLETLSDGVLITGQCRTTANFAVYDNVKFTAGSSSDLEIYHDGNHSYISDSGTGYLILRGSEIQLQSTGGADLAKFVPAGAVELYHDNSKKFETTTNGASITGKLELSDNLDMPNSAKVILGNGDDLQIYHDGSNSYISEGGTGSLKIPTNQLKVLNNPASADEVMIQATQNAHVELYYDGSKKLHTYDTGVIFTGDIRPNTTNTKDCGVNGAKWDDVYATNGTIQTSDRNEKNTIVASDLGLDFINKLNPVSYKFNNKTRTHYGLIAQDIETVLNDIGKPSSGFAGFIKEDDMYGLRYNEFLSPLIKAVQELAAKVAALEGA